MCMGRTDLTSLRTGCKIKIISMEFIATPQPIVLTYNIATGNCFYTVCGVAIHTVNSMEMMLILQPAIVTSKSVRPVHVEIGYFMYV